MRVFEIANLQALLLCENRARKKLRIELIDKEKRGLNEGWKE